MQERRVLGEAAEFGRLAKCVSGKGLCQRRAKRMTEPETAMAVARTTAWELKREDISVGRRAASYGDEMERERERQRDGL